MLWVLLVASGCDGPGGSPAPGARETQSPAADPWGAPIYTSDDLAGHSVSAENLGAVDAGAHDVAIRPDDGLGRVVSNVRGRPGVFVNAIGHRKFIEKLPTGRPVAAGVFRYAADVRLPAAARPNTSQQTNPQAVHVMVQFWDGRDAVIPADRHTLEGTLYWDLNPWTPDECGKVKIYAYPLELIDTGLRVGPDTEWHRFELTVDLAARRYVSAAVDGASVDLSAHRLAEVEHRDWGRELALIVTTESLAAYPGREGATFTWTTEFRNLSLWQRKE